jgi:hypothetical protein
VDGNFALHLLIQSSLTIAHSDTGNPDRACFGISPVFGTDFTMVVNNVQQLEETVATRGRARRGFVPSSDGATELKFCHVFFQVRPPIKLPSVSTSLSILAQGLYRDDPIRSWPTHSTAASHALKEIMELNIHSIQVLCTGKISITATSWAVGTSNLTS